MLSAERKALIIRLVNERNSITITELVEIFDTSESTIRRDLIALDKEGKIKKVFGGAQKIDMPEQLVAYDDNFTIRSTQNLEAKLKIGKYAASLIEDDDLVFLDAGTSTYMMIEFLIDSKATFVTNGLKQAQALAGAKLNAYLLGGNLKSDTEAVVGGEAVRSLWRYNFTKGFFGVNGVTGEGGFMTPEAIEASVKEMALSKSKQVYVLADHSKFGHRSMVSFAPIERGTIITDENPGRDIMEKTEVIKVK
ncbi:MAG: DeoR/GlpR family DNA-binding transcription regulator [Erysipelotrichaceae bacterium]|nr:DeoR/GlpR family DNA-binding transcription regulator [Erysipelotrichaceae bacterium]